MSSGFGSMLGYMVTFFLILGLFITGIFIVVYQLELQSYVVKSSMDDFKYENNYNLNFELPFNNSGRISFYIENLGENLNLKDANLNDCYEMYVNNKYVSKSDIFFNLNKSILGNYFVILNNDFGIFSIDNSLFNFQDGQTNIIKFVDCQGKQNIFSLNQTNLNLYGDENVDVSIFLIENSLASSQTNSNYIIELNENNFDFRSSLDELSFRYSLYQNEVLDLSFDIFNQSLNDYSKFNNDVYLGDDNSIETVDPENVSGIIGNGLRFDGENYLRINNDGSLRLSDEFTFSTWINWDQVGNETQYIYFNGQDSNSVLIKNSGGTNKGKIQFNLEIDELDVSLLSDEALDEGWHFLICTYDGNNMKIYIDGKNVGTLSLSGGINSVYADNFIGSDGSKYFFEGSLDELKLFNIALDENEILDLYHNNLRFRDLSYSIQYSEIENNFANVSVTIPYILGYDTINIDMYYNKIY